MIELILVVWGKLLYKKFSPIPLSRTFTAFYSVPSKGIAIGVYPKGQFSKTRYISKEVCRIFAFVDTNAVLVRKIDKS